MRIHDLLTDQATLAEVGHRVEQHRLDRNITQESFANEAGISRRTLQRLEAGHTVQMTSFCRVLRTLDLLAGFESLLPPVAPSPMERLERAGALRQRAREPRRQSEEREGAWSWGDEPSGTP